MFIWVVVIHRCSYSVYVLTSLSLYFRFSYCKQKIIRYLIRIGMKKCSPKQQHTQHSVHFIHSPVRTYQRKRQSWATHTIPHLWIHVVVQKNHIEDCVCMCVCVFSRSWNTFAILKWNCVHSPFFCIRTISVLLAMKMRNKYNRERKKVSSRLGVDINRNVQYSDQWTQK